MALEVRGTLRYWGWLLNVEPDPAAAKQLLKDAQTDLETAVRVRPSQAGAWAILSHLYSNTKGETDAKLAGLRAYEADAYLSDAPQVINRLFLTSYDLGPVPRGGLLVQRRRPPFSPGLQVHPSASSGC